MKAIFVALFFIAGCSSVNPVDVGPYQAAVYDKPSCSQVTVSNKEGKNHAKECDVR